MSGSVEKYTRDGLIGRCPTVPLALRKSTINEMKNANEVDNGDRAIFTLLMNTILLIMRHPPIACNNEQ